MRLFGDRELRAPLPKFDVKEKVILNLKEKVIAKVKWRFYEPDLETWCYMFQGRGDEMIFEQGISSISSH